MILISNIDECLSEFCLLLLRTLTIYIFQLSMIQVRLLIFILYTNKTRQGEAKCNLCKLTQFSTWPTLVLNSGTCPLSQNA